MEIYTKGQMMMSKYSLSKKVMPGACIGIHKNGDLMRRDTIVYELNRKDEIINELAEALKASKGFAEWIQILAKPDAEIYKHELCADSSVVITRIERALNKVENNG